MGFEHLQVQRLQVTLGESDDWLMDRVWLRVAIRVSRGIKVLHPKSRGGKSHPSSETGCFDLAFSEESRGQ